MMRFVGASSARDKLHVGRFDLLNETFPAALSATVAKQCVARHCGCCEWELGALALRVLR